MPLVVCETDRGHYVVRPDDWSGKWNAEKKIQEGGLNHLAIFQNKDDAYEFVEFKQRKEYADKRYATGEVTVDYMRDFLDNLCKHGYGNMKIKCYDGFVHENELRAHYDENILHINGLMFNKLIVRNEMKLERTIKNALEEFLINSTDMQNRTDES